MKVAVIGGTGFVGCYIQDELIEQGHHPVLLVRPGNESKVEHPDQCTTVSGDVKDLESVRKTLEGCDAAIYSIGILREFRSKGITYEELQLQGAKRTIDVALELGVQRFILMSANGVKPNGTPYQQTKYLAEQYVEATALEWTIFRPSVIYGEPRGRMEFCTQIRDQMIKLPLPAPLFYKGLFPIDVGTFAMSPVHVKDVAKIFVKTLTMPETVRQTYPLCGPDSLEWRMIIQILAQAIGTRKLALPVPAFVVKSIASLLEGFEFFPITQDQITMLMEGNVCDSSEVFELFDIAPVRFNEYALSYLRD